jgi:putative transposase
MEIHKAYKFRLYPNKEQEILINKSIGSCRFVYNYFLDYKTKYYTEHKNDKKKSLSFIETEHLLTILKKDESCIWLNEINSQSLQYSLRNLDSAYTRFFKKQASFPTFHKKRNGGSFTVPQFFNIVEEGNKFSFIKIPKLKSLLKFKQSRKIKGKILYCTISKTSTDKYYISFTVKEEIKLIKNKKENIIGIDVGIKSFVVTSNNEVILNDRNIKRKERRRKLLQRKISKAKKGGNNRKKLVKKLAIKHEKETNVRKNFLHQVSNYIIKNQDIIIVEDLNVKGMIRNHKLAKALSHQSFGEFFRQLQYKSEWNNKIFYKINRWYPSSQICNYCGHQNKNLKLSDRNWICLDCNKEIDRDLNAAKNIRDLGLHDLNINISTVGIMESYASGRVKITDFNKIKSVNSNERRNHSKKNDSSIYKY